MRRSLDFLGITRIKGAPRPKLVTALVSGLGLFLVLFGIAVVGGIVTVGSSGRIWIGSTMILIGVACWVAEGFMTGRAEKDEPSR
jgi:hypothetical protein